MGNSKRRLQPLRKYLGFVNHDLARSYAYRWGEDAIAGFCDSDQVLCIAPAFWNGKDPILKERLFGLTNNEGNHGEDVKELYFHLDSSPTHSYCRFLYKYPQHAFPYMQLIQQSQRDRLSPEFELLDTGILNDNRYFNCYIEYAKAGVADILLKITAFNRGPEKATIHVLPHIWFRNFWKHNIRFSKENETNNERMYHRTNDVPYVKDGISDYIVNNHTTISPAKEGTKAAVWLKADIAPGKSRTFRVRLSAAMIDNPWNDFEAIMAKRRGRRKFKLNVRRQF